MDHEDMSSHAALVMKPSLTELTDKAWLFIALVALMQLEAGKQLITTATLTHVNLHLLCNIQVPWIKRMY